MTRRLGIGLLALALAFFGRVVADDPAADQPEPPVRLKKKARPRPAEPAKEKAEPAKEKAQPSEPAPEKKPQPPPEEPGEEGDKELEGKDPGEEAKEALARASKNMRVSEERLARKDPGQGTRQIQQDILKDLDALIKQTQRQQQQQQQQQQSSNSPSPRNRSGQQARGEKKLPRNQKVREQRTAQGKQPKDSPATRGQGGGKGTKGGESKIADLYKDVWGHLPESLRQEMDQYSREQFMAKYSDLLQQYYSTIAEKGRKSSP